MTGKAEPGEHADASYCCHVFSHVGNALGRGARNKPTGEHGAGRRLHHGWEHESVTRWRGLHRQAATAGTSWPRRQRRHALLMSYSARQLAAPIQLVYQPPCGQGASPCVLGRGQSLQTAPVTRTWWLDCARLRLKRMWPTKSCIFSLASTPIGSELLPGTCLKSQTSARFSSPPATVPFRHSQANIRPTTSAVASARAGVLADHDEGRADLNKARRHSLPSAVAPSSATGSGRRLSHPVANQRVRGGEKENPDTTTVGTVRRQATSQRASSSHLLTAGKLMVARSTPPTLVRIQLDEETWIPSRWLAVGGGSSPSSEGNGGERRVYDGPGGEASHLKGSPITVVARAHRPRAIRRQGSRWSLGHQGRSGVRR